MSAREGREKAAAAAGIRRTDFFFEGGYSKSSRMFLLPAPFFFSFFFFSFSFQVSLEFLFPFRKNNLLFLAEKNEFNDYAFQSLSVSDFNGMSYISTLIPASFVKSSRRSL